MGRHAALNPRTWQLLQDHGFVPGEDLAVNTFTYLPAGAAAEEVALVLEARGWRTEISSSRSGLLRRRVMWLVMASRLLEAPLPADIDAMTNELETLAAGHGGDLDGWEAAVP